MPKVLSLKKAQKTAPAKNQMAITQFFRNTNASVTQKQQASPNKSQSCETKSIQENTFKRKVISPVENIEILDESSYESDFCTPKKFKKQHDSTQRTPTKSNSHNKCYNVSPEKENGIISQKSHIKSITNNDVVLYHVAVDLTDHKDIRSPLAPVKTENNIEESPKSNSLDTKNHVQSQQCIVDTPKQVLFENHDQDIQLSPKMRKISPKKNVAQEFQFLPKLTKLRTPEKLTKDDLSPSKSGATVKTLDFSQHGVDDVFGDEWELGDIGEDCSEDLDLSIMQRCEVLSVTRDPSRLELRLKNASNHRGTCFVEGIWLDTPLSPGEVISVLATRDSSGQYYVGNNSGLLTLRPDHLVSSTSVVAGVFCKRKALLQERWRGIDSSNIFMTIGILVHELVQKALTQNIKDIAQLRTETDKILKQSVQMLYDAGLAEDEARTNMQTYIQPLAEFMQTYLGEKSSVGKNPPKDQWCGHIDKVLDIEENICSPQLGLKGKIDATLQVTIHERKGGARAVVPLELKSGKASVSAEHRGQLVLYGMMLSLQRSEDPTRAELRGLLLYLRDRVDLREVSCGYPERRDLVMLRNQLVHYLAAGPQDVDPEQLTDIEDASCLLQQKLPEPVHHETACAKCPYLTLCSLHLWHTDGPSVSETHPLSKLREQALGHLTSDHVKYFLHWTALLKMEERGHMSASPLHALWTDSVEKRASRGTCAASLKLMSVEASGDRFLHRLERPIKEIDKLSGDWSRAKRGPHEGEFSIVSIDSRPWIAAGVVQTATEKEITILLERDLSQRQNKGTLFHIDTYESYATTVQNLTNLGVLLEDSDRALRLRRLIIDKDPPQFDKKLPREVGRLGSKLMRSLNIEQQRAVLKALGAKEYALLQGLPGTGKTQTISVLIQMLAGLKQRVLVTAHTHSAVDTVLSRLPASLRVMRLGSSARVAPSLLSRCENQLAASCDSPKQLEQLYDSMDVVGVTCLGASHPMLARTTFDVCIVDEATQVLQCTVLRPLFAARRFVLVGDPDQLPPVVRSRAARRLGMEESLFHRLMSAEATCALQLQYRMNRPLAELANRVAYHSRLRCADGRVADAKLSIHMERLSHSEAAWLVRACGPQPENAALFLDTRAAASAAGRSCANPDEACVVLALVDALILGGVEPSDIGVIAPYRDQVTLLRRALCRRGVEGSTVDQFQGRDKCVIVYSCTKRVERAERMLKEGEILNDQRRLAVSVTRAKHKLLVVGDSRALLRFAPMQRLIDACAALPLDSHDLDSVMNKYRTEFV